MTEQKELYKKSDVKITQEIFNIEYNDYLNSVNPDFDFISHDNKKIAETDKLKDSKLYDLMVCDKIDDNVIYDIFDYDKTEFFKCLNKENIIELPEFLKNTKKSLISKVEGIKSKLEDKIKVLLFVDGKVKPYFIYCLRNLLLYYKFLNDEKNIQFMTVVKRLEDTLKGQNNINITDEDIKEKKEEWEKLKEDNEKLFDYQKKLMSNIIEYCQNIDKDINKIEEIIKADEDVYNGYMGIISDVYNHIVINPNKYASLTLEKTTENLKKEIEDGKQSGFNAYKSELQKQLRTAGKTIPNKPTEIKSDNVGDVFITHEFKNFYPSDESIYIKDFHDKEELYIKWIVYYLNLLTMLENIKNQINSENIINVDYIKFIFFFNQTIESIEKNKIYNENLTTNIKTIIDFLISVNKTFTNSADIKDQNDALTYNKIPIPPKPTTEKISDSADIIKSFYLDFDFNISLDNDEINTLLNLLTNDYENMQVPIKQMNNFHLTNKLNGQIKEFYNFSTNNYLLTLFYDDKEITTSHGINSGLLNFPVHRIYIASQYYNDYVFNALRKNKKYINIKIEDGKFYFKDTQIKFLNLTNNILYLLYGYEINQDFNTMFIDNETFKIISENEEEKQKYINYKNQVDIIKELALSDYKTKQKSNMIEYITDIKLILTSEQIKTEKSDFNKDYLTSLKSDLITGFIDNIDQLRNLNKSVIELNRLQEKVKFNTEKDYSDYMTLKEESKIKNREFIDKIQKNYKISFNQNIIIDRENNNKQEEDNKKKLYNLIALFYDFLTNKILVNTKTSEIYNVFTDKFIDFIIILFSVLIQNYKFIKQYEKTVREFLKTEITDLNDFLLNRQRIIEQCTGIIIFVSEKFYNIPLNDNNFIFISEILNKVNDYYSEFEDFVEIKGQKITIENSNRESYLEYQNLLAEKEKISEEFKNIYLKFLDGKEKEEELTKIIGKYNETNKEIEKQEDIILNVKHKQTYENIYDKKFNDEIKTRYLNKLVDIFEKLKAINENNGNKEINNKIDDYIELLKKDEKDNKNLIKSVLYNKHKNYINPRVGQRLTNQEIRGYNNLLSDSLFDLIKSNQIKKGDYFLLSKTGNIKNAYIYLLNDFSIIDNNSCLIKVNNENNLFDLFSKIQDEDNDMVKTIKKYKNNTCTIKGKLNEIAGKTNINFLGKYKLVNQ